MLRKTILTFSVLCLLCCVVLADGGFVLPPPTPEEIKSGIKAAYLDEPQQQAVIVFDGAKETLYLRVRYKGTVEDFGWIIPVPARPQVEKGRGGLMAEIADFFYQLKLEEWKAGRLKRGGIIALGGDEGSGKDTKAPKPRKVKVIEAKRVGIYDLTVLKATEPDALADWLRKHKFQLPETQEAKEILKHYVDTGMYWCALRVCKGSRRTLRKASKGWIHPVTITFATERPFYPLRITAIHTRPRARTQVLIHLFSRPDSLSLRAGKRLGQGSFHQHEYRFEEKDLPKCCKAFPDLAGKNYILTTVEGVVRAPDMYDDLWFATQEEELAGPAACALWSGVLRADAGGEPDLPHVLRKCKEILADYPCTPWAAKAYERIQQMGDKVKTLGERDAQKRIRDGLSLMARKRFGEAVKKFRQVARMYPWRAAEAARNVQYTLSSEKAYLAKLWGAIQERKEGARKIKGFEEYYKSLVALMLLCRGLHGTQNIHDRTLKQRYYAAGLAEVQWVNKHYAALMEKKFHVTWKEVEWQAKRDPALAYRMCAKVIAVHPGTRYSDKAAGFLNEMLW